LADCESLLPDLRLRESCSANVKRAGAGNYISFPVSCVCCCVAQALKMRRVEIPADIFVRVSSISEAAMPATAEQPAKKQKLAFELPAINSDFDTFLKAQLEASPADAKDTEEFKYLTFTALPPFTDGHKSLMRKTMVCCCLFEGVAFDSTPRGVGPHVPFSVRFRCRHRKVSIDLILSTCLQPPPPLFLSSSVADKGII